MAQNIEKKNSKIEAKRERRFCRYEKRFSAHEYNGRGKEFIKEISGSLDIIVASPFPVNCVLVETVEANRNSGALARLLAYETGCRTLYTSKGFKAVEVDSVKRQYLEIVNRSKAKAVIELRTNDTSSKKIRIGGIGHNAEDSSSFFQRAAQYVIEYEYRDSMDKDIVEVGYMPEKSILFDIADRLQTPILILDIKESELRTTDARSFERVFTAIKKILMLLSSLDWAADSYDVYRVWQASSKSQIPQDKVAFVKKANNIFEENDFLHICSFEGIHETVRANAVNDNTLSELDTFLTLHPIGIKEDYVVLTNRLIEILFGREWFEGTEELPGLRGIPIIVYKNKKERYEIGIPKADQVNNIAFSSALYKEKMELSSKYDYLVFNNYTDSRIYIEVEKSDYQDNGRVKSKEGIINAKKVMLPRYYRLMMGYLEKPLKMIRAEEYCKIILDIPEKNEVTEKTDNTLKYEITKEDFHRCYQKTSKQPYYKLVEEKAHLESEEKKLYRDSKERVIKYLEKIGVYSHVELIRVPKQVKPKKKMRGRIRGLREKLCLKILKGTIGKAEYILKTSRAGVTDDKNSVARLNSNMMSLIGVSENDKILIRFGDNITTLRVLAKDDLTDYEIGIPSAGRRALKMNSMNDIVIVHRDMSHTFKRHSQEQTIAILGTVLAVAQVLTAFEIFTDSWLGIVIAVVVCILAIILILYFALSEERVKVK